MALYDRFVACIGSAPPAFPLVPPVRSFVVPPPRSTVPVAGLSLLVMSCDVMSCRRLLAYLCFFVLFFVVLILESDVTFQHAVETGITDFIAQVGSWVHGIRAAASRPRVSGVSVRFVLVLLLLLM